MKASIVLCMNFMMINIILSSMEFPLEEFLNISTSNTSKPHRNIYLCNSDACCGCEKECVFKKTCCIDKFWNTSNPIPLPQYLNNFIEEHKKVRKPECVQFLPFLQRHGYDTFNFYLMITECLSDAVEEDARKCSDNATLFNYEKLPVYGSNGYLYKNAFCAKCNSIKQYQPVNISLECPYEREFINKTTPILEAFRYCSVKIQKYHKAMKPFSCNPEEKKVSCSEQYLQDLCDTYKVYEGKIRNPHCLKCVEDMSKPILNPCLNMPLTTFPFSVAISFTGDSTIVEIRDKTFSFCSKGEHYNFVDQKCEKTKCAPGYQFESTVCAEIRRESKSFDKPEFLKCLTAWNATLYIDVKSHPDHFNIFEFTENFQRDFKESAEQFELLKGSTNLNPIYVRKKPMQYSDVARMQEIINNSTTLEIWDWNVNLFFASVSIKSLNHLYGFDLGRYFSDNRLCSSKRLVDISTGNFTESCQLRFTNTSQIIDNEYISLFTKFEEYGNTASISQCYQFHLNQSCHIIPINSSIHHFNNFTKELFVYFEEENKTSVYKPHEYLPGDDQTFYICSRDNQQVIHPRKYQWEPIIRDIESYSSLVFVIISFVFEILFVLTFIFNREIQTRGITNVLVLVILLLISDVLFLLIVISNGEPYNLCKAIAIIMHWVLLSIHIWGAVLAADIMNTLLTSRKNVTSQHVSRSIMYKMLFSILPTGFMVLVCVVLNEVDILDFGYGEKKICSITEFYPKLGAFLIPVVMTSSVNIICLTTTLGYLYYQEKGQQKTLRNSGRADMDLAYIAIKLIAALGSIEVLGLIQITKLSLTEDEKFVNSISGLLYTIIRCVRGTLVFFLYLGNKKTMNFYRRCLSKNERSYEITSKMKISETSI